LWQNAKYEFTGFYFFYGNLAIAVFCLLFSQNELLVHLLFPPFALSIGSMSAGFH
jgi:hypothetical protein